MKAVIRAALALVALFAGAVVLPVPGGSFVVPDAAAQVSSNQPPPTPSPSPSPSPTPTPRPSRRPTPTPNPTPGPTPAPSRTPRPSPSPSESPEPSRSPKPDKDGKKDDQPGSPFKGTFHPQGSFNTDKLVAIATRLRSIGWTQREILAGVYPPFIIGGEAAWTNTWGAARYGPGSIVRTHEGQDVFCRFGDPVLASEPGQVEYDDGGLGGKIARLRRPDGSYWYYAHLSDFNSDVHPAGSTVRTGDVIGFCGNTGNALSTPPHVHFGWYQVDGEARDPMRWLIRWLEEAERNARSLFTRETGKRLVQIEPLTTARRFGDTFMPDTSELLDATESLWATGSTPAAGAFGLAESVLQAALAESAFEAATSTVAPVDPSGASADDSGRGLLDPESQLAQLLSGGAPSSTGESGD